MVLELQSCYAFLLNPYLQARRKPPTSQLNIIEEPLCCLGVCCLRAVIVTDVTLRRKLVHVTVKRNLVPVYNGPHYSLLITNHSSNVIITDTFHYFLVSLLVSFVELMSVAIFCDHQWSSFFFSLATTNFLQHSY